MARVSRILAASVGVAVLDVIHKQFKIKSDGGTDVTGERWKPLSPTTIAIKKKKYPRNADKILREKDLLMDSLKPPLAGPVAAQTVPRVKHQVFRLQKGTVIIGSNRPFISRHLYGTRWIPQRRPWPAPGQWNAGWWQEILTKTRYVVSTIIVALIRRAGS